jgi:hypothetical protein
VLTLHVSQPPCEVGPGCPAKQAFETWSGRTTCFNRHRFRRPPPPTFGGGVGFVAVAEPTQVLPLCRLEIQSRSTERPEPVRPDGSAFVKREVTFLADPACFRTRDSGTDLPAERAVACVYLCYAAMRRTTAWTPCLLPRSGDKEGFRRTGAARCSPCEECRRRPMWASRLADLVRSEGTWPTSRVVGSTGRRVGPRMSRLVKRHPSATGKLERSRESPPLFGDLTRELDAFGLQLCDRRGDVVAHQVKLMVSTLVARMGGEFRGRKGEDGPIPAGVDRVESERVAEERTSTFGVVCEDDRVYAGDHRRPSLWAGGHLRKGGDAG